MITHTVLLKFTDSDDTNEARRRLLGLPDLIDQLRSLSVALDVARTEASYDLVLVTTHDDLEGLVGYQQHPVHQEFVQWLGPRLAARAVVDAQS